MKILITTQKVNINDPVLSFFHTWLTEFAKHFEEITVICLEKGEYHLPNNVRVLSLGKEESKSRLGYLRRFYSYIWRERKSYEAVFVHMNQEYLLVGGIFWRLMGKKVVMWRNHYMGNFLTDVAAFFCHKVLCTSAYSFTAKYKKTVFMPVGIDTDIFKPDPNAQREVNSILFLARMSPSKRPDMLLRVLSTLNKDGVLFKASFYGDPGKSDAAFYESLKKQAVSFGISDHVAFEKGVPNNQTPRIYSSHEICINLSPSGMFDKTIFESMACGAFSLSSNKNLEGKIDPRLYFEEADENMLALKIKDLFRLTPEQKQNLQKWSIDYVKNHSLASLASSLYSLLQSIKSNVHLGEK